MLRTWVSAGVVNDSWPNEIGTSKRALAFAAIVERVLRKQTNPCLLLSGRYYCNRFIALISRCSPLIWRSHANIEHGGNRTYFTLFVDLFPHPRVAGSTSICKDPWIGLIHELCATTMSHPLKKFELQSARANYDWHKQFSLVEGLGQFFFFSK